MSATSACTVCQVVLVRGDNWYDSSANHRQKLCKKCLCARSIAWSKENKEWKRERDRKATDRKLFGIEPGDRERLYEFQAGRCYLCLRQMTKSQNTCVDHCHRTGHVRGLACRLCNCAISFFEENPQLISDVARRLGDPSKYPAAILNIGQNGVGQQCGQD